MRGYKIFGGGSYSYGNNLRSNEFIPVRVVDVILDDNHPEYSKYGYSSSIGAIKYAPVDNTVNAEDPKVLNVAYPISSTIRTLPLKNEIVLLISAPDQEIQDNRSTGMTVYYTTIVSIWNHPYHNKIPNIVNQPDSKDTSGFPEKDNINPLQPFPGDVLVEGRLGQSIRLGGSQARKNKLTDGGNNGDPFTIISNGQKEVGDGSQHIVEDINADAASIYLVSNHTVPILPSRINYTSLRNKPPYPQQYRGSQVIINGGRLVFNSKDESILLSSKKDFHASGEYIGLDATKELALEGEKIYLGAEALGEFEPVPKGDTLVNILLRMARVLDGIGTAFQNSMVNSNPPSKDLSLVSEAQTIIQSMNGIKSDIQKIKSKKVFTE